MKKLATFLFLVVFLFAFAINVNAANETILNVSKNEVSLGEEIILSIGLDTQNEEETSLYAYTAKLSYNKDVFEVITTEDFQEQENWSDINYNRANNKFALINKRGESGDKLLQIKLKVKEDAIPGETSITVNSIKASDGKKEIPLESKTIQVTVIKDGLAEGESLPSSKVEEIAVEENTSIEVGKDNSWVGYLLIALMVVIIVFLIYYIKKSNEKKTPSNKKMMIIVVAIILLIALLVLTINILSNKNADVNADGVIDYDDAKEIIEYLLEIKNPQDDENIEDKDINKDGKVDITDVAGSTNQATNQNHSASTSGGNSSNGNSGNNNKPSNPTNPAEESSPEVNYSSIVENSTVSNLTPKKEEEITLDLHIDITPYTEVEAVECNGKFYQVTKVKAEPIMLASLKPINLKKVATNNENNHYTTTIQAPRTAGVQDIKITSVRLDNGKVVPTSFKVTVDVLKDKPKVENFKIDDKKTIPEISFNFVDDDNALKNSKFVIKDEVGNIVEEYNDIKKGQNTFTANLVDGKTYHYDFDVDYDLDHDYFSENDYYAKEDFIDGIFEDKNGNLEFTRDYGFRSKNMEVTAKVTKQEDLILSFENDYNSYYDVRGVIINNTEYPVIKNENGQYTVVLPKSEGKGNHSITIQSVVLENGHEEKIDRTFDYIVLKDSPTIDEIEATLNEGNLKVEVTTTDADETIKKVVVKVKDKNGSIVKTQELENKTSADIQIEASGTYTVEVEVTYDLGDGLEATITKTYDEEITEPIKANITNSTITPYVEKGGIVEVIYTIEDNTDKEITNILINGTKLPVTKTEDGKYKVTFNAPDTRKVDGKESIEATKVYYENEEVEVNCALEIEILKSEPTIEDLYIDDSGEKPVLHFVLQDAEKAFVSGTIIITNANESQKININTEETAGNVVQNYTLEGIKEFVEYKLSINITYDLDTNKGNGLNENAKTLKEHTFEIQKNYNLTLSDFKLKEVNSTNVVLQFTSTNESKYSIEKVEVALNGVKHEYEITRNENVYTVEIPLSDINNVRTEITLEEIILSNLKEFNRETDADFAKLNSVIVFKTVPTATIGSVTVNDTKNEITANNITFTDTDSTITKKYAILKLNDELIEEIEITTENSVTFKAKNAEMFDAKTYTIEILATYSTVDGKTHEKEVISQAKEITVDKVAKVTAVSEKQYAEKGSTATVTFTIKSNTTEDITDLEINGELPVSFEKGENGIYKVTVNVPNTTGIEDYKITKIVYGDTEITIADSLKAQVYVLKDAPIISDNVFDDEAVPPTYTFTFTDTEATLINGSIVVKEGTAEVKTQELTTGGNKVVLDGLTKGKTYTLSLNGAYDLDDDKSDTKNKHNLSELLGEVKLEIIDYKVTLNNVEINNINKEEKTVTISFTVQNSHPEYDVTEIKIGENFYTVTKQENGTYTATINYEQIENEKVVITINNVKMTNGKIVKLTTPVTFEILKKAPKVTELTTNIAEEKIKTTFAITDEDNTITADTLKAELRDEEGNIVETKPITKENKEVTFDTNKAGTYKVTIVADYDLVDGEKYLNKILDTSNSVTIEIKAKIIESELATKYPTKKQNMTIKYTIEDNTDKEVTAIEINGVKNVNVVTTSEDVYTVTYTAPDNHGKATITASKLYYGDKEVEVEDVVDNIDVLKSRPYLVNKLEEDFEVYEDFANKTIKVVFTVNDPDNACISNEGYVCLAYGKFKDASGNDKVPYKIGEKTTITFVNVENGAWMLHIYAPPFDLDSNKEDDYNHYIKEGDSSRTIIRAVQFMRDPSELHVANISAVTETKENTKYLDKNEQYKLSFTADMLNGDNKNYYPQYVRLSGESNIKERTFELERNENTYTTKNYFDGYKEVGAKTVEIESIILNNGEVIKMTDKKLEIDVLRDKLTVSDFKVNTEGETPKATFNITDNDNSFVDGKIIITKKSDNTVKEIAITKNVTEYNLELEVFEQYEVKLQVNYDLDSEHGKENTGTVEFSEDVEIVKPYNLKIADLKVVEVNVEQATVTLEFTSTNASKHKISKIRIDGIENAIEVNYNEASGKYTATLFFENANTQKQTLTITNVILDNEQEIKPTGTLSVDIFKNKPTVENLSVIYNKEEKTVNASFNIKDDDQTISKVYAKLISPSEEETEKEVALTDKNGNINFSDVTKAGTYTVEILADYDTKDGKEHNKEIISTNTVEVEIVVTSITTTNITNIYPAKNEIVEITYNIEDNTDEPITAIEYDGTHISERIEVIDGDYKAILKQDITATAGIKDLKVTKIHYGEKTIDVSHDGDKIDVLKDIPTFDDSAFSSTSELENSTVVFTFDILNPDNAEINGTATVGENSQSFSSTHNILGFNVVKNKDLELVITFKYDRDTDTIDEKEDKNTGEITVKKQFSLMENMHYDINEMYTSRIDTQTYKETRTQYFNKDEEFRLAFTTTTNSNFTVTHATIDNIKYEVKQIHDEANIEQIDGYYVTLNASNEIGAKDITINSITLSDGEEIKLENKTLKYEVLKDKPVIQSFNVNNEGTKITISINVTDTDKALKEGSKVIITDLANDEEKFNKPLVEGPNKFEFAAELNKTYIIKVINSYDLDSDILNPEGEKSNEHEEVYTEKEIKIEDEAKFAALHVTIPKVVKDNDKNVVLTFENGYQSIYDVKKATINGDTYDVQKDKNIYSIELDKGKKGDNTIEFNSVKLENESEFEVNRNLTYLYENEKPEAKLTINEEREEKQVKVSFDITDKDSAIKKLYVRLKNSNGVQIQEIELTDTTVREVKFSLPMAYKYSVDILADYDKGNGTDYEKILIGSEVKEVGKIANIAEFKPNSQSVEKNGTVSIEYKVDTNIDEQVEFIRINGVAYASELIGDNTYRTEFDGTGSQGGTLTLKVEQLKFENERQNTNYTSTIEVLRTKPEISEVVTSKKNGKFDLYLKAKDDDNAITGNINLKILNGDSEIIKEENINLDEKKQYNLNTDELQFNTKYKLIISADYDLDGGVVGNNNEHYGETLLEKEIQVDNEFNYNFNFENFAVSSPMALYGYSLDFTFTSTNDSKYKVDTVVIDGVGYKAELTKEEKNEYTITNYVVNKKGGVHTVTAEKVILSNGMAFDIKNKNQTAFYEVMGDVPKASIFEILEDNESGKLKVSFQIIDSSNAIKEDTLAISLYGETSKQPIERKSIKKNDTYVEFDLPLSSTYKVQITATVVLSELFMQPDENAPLITREIKAKQDTLITNVKPETYYPEKGAIFGVDYTILTSKTDMIKAIIIDGERYEVTPYAKNVYRVYLTADNNAGIMTFTTSAVEFEKGDIAEYRASGQVDLLKELPVITDFTRTDNYEEKSATFTFNLNDNDKIINSGGKFTANVAGQNKEIQIGSNTITFNNLTLNANIDFNIIGTYDLDTDQLNAITQDKNSYTNKSVFNRKFLYSENNDLYKINNLQTVKDNKPNVYFEKDDEVRVKFNFIWVDDTYIEKATVNGVDYNVYKEDETYTIVLNKFNEAGKHDISLEKIKLSNGKEITLENKTLCIETLKDEPSMSKFDFEEKNNNILLNITILDPDRAISEGEKLNIKVFDENNVNIYTGDLNVGDNTVTFTKDNSNRYSFKISASYDRDTNELDDESNIVTDKEIASENINVNERKYELKEITNIDVYQFQNDGSVGIAKQIDLNKINSHIENYIVKIEMKSLPAYYGKIKQYKVENDKLIFTLSADNIIIYNGNEATKNCDVIYGNVIDDIATKENCYSVSNSSPEKLYIPDYDRIKQVEGYSPDKDKIYYNLNKLMPFYDSKYIVRDGAKLETDSILNKKLIKDVIPVNENGEALVAVTTDDYQKLSAIKVIFEDDDLMNYSIQFNEYYSGIASYIIPELNVEYNYNNYVLKSDARIIQIINNAISKYDYRTDLDILTKAEDSRIYREYYEDTIKPNLDDFIKKLLVSKNYSVVAESDTYNTLIEQDLLKDDTLMKWIYAYNYMYRWYSFDIDGLKMSDVFMFKGNILNKPATIENITDDVLSGNINTAATDKFYSQKLAKYTNQSDMFKFMEYYVSKFAEDKNIKTWYRDNVPGIVVEVPCANKEVEYTIWHNLKTGSLSNYILVLLTLPDDAAYIISNPTSILIGAQRIYIQNPNDPVQRAQLETTVQNYAKNIGSFYSSVATFAPVEQINKTIAIHLDTRFTFVDGGNNSRIVQSPLTTQEPFHKNFDEVLNKWPALSGFGAYAGPGGLYYIYNYALHSFSTWSHETAHLAPTISLFIGDGWLKPRVQGEDIPDANIAQGFGDSVINFNLTYNFDKNALISTNLTPERIDTDEKMKDFYSKLIDTNDFLDYIEAKAFLQLTPEQQAVLCLQVSYPTPREINPDSEHLPGEWTKYQKITKEEIEKMNLSKTDVHDLWKNQIVMIPGVTTKTNDPGMYGGDTIYTRRWYQPHNDKTRVDSYNFKWLAFEMIGTGGFKGGYQLWYGNGGGSINNDLDSLRAITQDPTMTFEQYKINRYAKMQENWDNMLFFDADEVEKEYLEALQKDADAEDYKLTNSTAVKRKYYYMVKQGTDDFVKDVFGYKPEKDESVKHASNAEEFIKLCKEKPNSTIYLDADIDLSGYTTGNAIVTNTFSGTIECENHTITGLRIPLFASLNNATINNLVINNSNVIVNATDVGALAKTITGTKLNNIVVKDTLISSKENKHTGALVGSAYSSNIEDCHVFNVNVFGANRTGALIGYATDNCIIKECSANGSVSAAGDASAVFIGQCDKSNIKNCYAIGTVSGLNTAKYIGGLVGWAENTSIHNNYVKVSISINNSYAGVFSGTLRGTTYDVQNNIAIANGLSNKDIGLFDNDTNVNLINNSNLFKNNYEISNECVGRASQARKVNEGKIKAIEAKELTKQFMIEKLGWSEDIWKLDLLEQGKLPRLKKHDPNNEEIGIKTVNVDVQNSILFGAEQLNMENSDETANAEEIPQVTTPKPITPEPTPSAIPTTMPTEENTSETHEESQLDKDKIEENPTEKPKQNGNNPIVDNTPTTTE